MAFKEGRQPHEIPHQNRVRCGELLVGNAGRILQEVMEILLQGLASGRLTPFAAFPIPAEVKAGDHLQVVGLCRLEELRVAPMFEAPGAQEQHVGAQLMSDHRQISGVDVL